MNNEQPTLLDQFAMAALTGLLANPDNTKQSHNVIVQKANDIAYLMAIESSKQ